MVSGLGLEPRMTGPKPVVIPFHHPEVNLPYLFIIHQFSVSCKEILLARRVKRGAKYRAPVGTDFTRQLLRFVFRLR